MAGNDAHEVLTVAEPEAGERLDRFLARRLPSLSRSRLQALIRAGHVLRDGAAEGGLGRRIRSGETYAVHLPEPEPAAIEPQAMPLSIVHEDAHLIVIDKPKGLPVHPGPGHADGTLVNALIAHCGASLSGIGGVKRPGIVHRLDKDTTGLLVVAKTDRAHQGLAEQFAAHGADGRLERRYLAIVWGAPERTRGTIDANLARSHANRTKIAVVGAEAGRRAVTRYEVLATYPRVAKQGAASEPIASLLALTLETGRTHQVRAHLAHIGHPLLGDMTYGAGFKASARNLSADAQAALADLGRQALHAAGLAFVHPMTGKRVAFESPPPPDMARLLAALAASR
jgi:23S rRNA pseudouridine1911/1915/1917 synthase